MKTFIIALIFLFAPWVTHASSVVDSVLFGASGGAIPAELSSLRNALQSVQSYHDAYATEYAAAVYLLEAEISGRTNIVDPYDADAVPRVYRTIARLDKTRYRYDSAIDLLQQDLSGYTGQSNDVRSAIRSIRQYSSRSGSLHSPVRSMLSATAEWYRYVGSRRQMIAFSDGQYVFASPVDEQAYHFYLKSLRDRLPVFIESVDVSSATSPSMSNFNTYIAQATRPLTSLAIGQQERRSYCDTGHRVIALAGAVDSACSLSTTQSIARLRQDAGVTAQSVRLADMTAELRSILAKHKTRTARSDYARMYELATDSIQMRYALDIDRSYIFRSAPGARSGVYQKYAQYMIFTMPENDIKSYRFKLAQQSAAIEFEKVLAELITRDTSVEMRHTPLGYELFLHRPIPDRVPAGSTRPVVDSYFKRYGYVFPKFRKTKSLLATDIVSSK